jgi:hypothetical protein
MSFSASTCITFNPTIQFSTGPFDIYLDSDYSSTPFLTNVELSDLSPPNCPYVIGNIPNGTTNLGIKDIENDYCVTIPIQNNDICSNCNLGFSNYSASTISKLYCGNLTGTCTPINDYVINWYGPNDTTTLAFTSGKGSLFNYQYPHPFSTTSTSIPVTSGIYTPVIEKIVLSGLTFSNTGGTGNILFSGDCLQTTNILSLTCDVKTNPLPNWNLSAYTNYLSFDSQTGGSPLPVSTTYKISASTKYIVWSFSGDQNPDRITLYFSGTSYPNNIGLEDFVIGNGLLSSDFSASTYPKSAKTNNYFVKYTCLTGLTVNNDDNIIIDVTPASSETKWTLLMSCLEDFECGDCYSTRDYKIIGSSITGITGTCDIISINFRVSGCSYPDTSSDYISYYLSKGSYNIDYNPYTSISTFNSDIIYRGTSNLFFNNTVCTLFTTGSLASNCQTDTTPTRYDKTFLTDGSNRGVYGFTGSSTFISTYYNSISNAFLGLTPYWSTWSGSSNSTDISYYRYFFLKLPKFESPLTCLDGSLSTHILLHHTSQFVTGTTGGSHFLKVTANTISQNLFFNTCDQNCDSNIKSVVFNVNSYSTGTTSPYTGTTREYSNGMYYTNPVYECYYNSISNTSNTGSTFNDGFFVTPDWAFNTYPFSGTPSTIIPSLSGTVCNFNTSGVNTVTYNSFYRNQYKYYYQVRLTNPSDVRDFDIWASPISNFSYSGAPGIALYELAYRTSGGTITTNPTYII